MLSCDKFTDHCRDMFRRQPENRAWLAGGNTLTVYVRRDSVPEPGTVVFDGELVLVARSVFGTRSEEFGVVLAPAVSVLDLLSTSCSDL